MIRLSSHHSGAGGMLQAPLTELASVSQHMPAPQHHYPAAANLQYGGGKGLGDGGALNRSTQEDI